MWRKLCPITRSYVVAWAGDDVSKPAPPRSSFVQSSSLMTSSSRALLTPPVSFARTPRQVSSIALTLSESHSVGWNVTFGNAFE